MTTMALARLAFIARAKQLGCTLEEISDLSLAWMVAVVARSRTDSRAGRHEAGRRRSPDRRVGHVVRRVAGAIGARTSPTRRSLRRPVRRSSSRRDGHVGVARGQTDRGGRRPDGVHASPTRCRTAWTTGRWSSGSRARTSVEGGVRLDLDPTAPLDEFARLAAAEQDCCRFFSFALTITSGLARFEPPPMPCRCAPSFAFLCSSECSGSPRSQP